MTPVKANATLIGDPLGAEEHRLRDFLTRGAQPFRWIDAGTPEANALLRQHGVDESRLPVLIDEDGAIAPASVEKVAEAWRISTPPRRESYDLAIVGGGPAGLAAAVYAASDGLSTLVLERDVPGGQASYTSMIENFFGFPEGIGGAELSRLAGRQAERFGAELAIRHGVTSHTVSPDGVFHLTVDERLHVQTPLLIACPGMDWRRLDIPGVEELLDHGVYYGAGRSEAVGCEGRDVVVVGGGNSGGQAARHLAGAGARVRMLVRGDRLGRSMSAYLVERIEADPMIEVRLRTEVEAVESDEEGHLSAVTARNNADGRSERIPAQYMFLCLGGVPRTGWAEESGVRVSATGYVLTGPDLLRDGSRPENWKLDRDPLALETSVPGLFAAGDVRNGSTKRVGGAVGEGAMATAQAEHRLEELNRSGPPGPE